MLFRIYLEEISVCVRVVHEREDNKKVQVREEFLGFVQAESTTGQALAERFLETQQGYGLDIDRMRAQCYDGAAKQGVQTIIRRREMGACRGGETKQPGGYTKLHK